MRRDEALMGVDGGVEVLDDNARVGMRRVSAPIDTIRIKQENTNTLP
jgi:hypothetical protein